MDPQQNLRQIQDLFLQARDILIVAREQPSIDVVASGLALKALLSSLKDPTGKPKKVVMAVSGRNGSQYSALPGSETIVSEFGLRDFVIGVNGYVDGCIEGVNWYVDRGKLHVVFKSNPAVPMQFDTKSLDPFYAGSNFDVVLVLGAANPQDLGNTYKQDPGLFAELPVVNVSNDHQNSRFGKINIVDPSVGSIAELCFQLSQILQVPVSPDAAGLFMVALMDGTHRMQKTGPQSQSILSQLQAMRPTLIDLDTVNAQSNLPVLPIHKTVISPLQASGPIPPQVPPGYPFPPQGIPGYSPNGVPPGYYPPYAPQGYYPPPYPYYPNGSVPPQTQHNVPVIPEPNTGYVQENYAVPSMQRDAYSQESLTIPTSPIDASQHVAPVYNSDMVSNQQMYYSPDPIPQQDDADQAWEQPSNLGDGQKLR